MSIPIEASQPTDSRTILLSEFATIAKPTDIRTLASHPSFKASIPFEGNIQVNQKDLAFENLHEILFNSQHN